uniref:Uncharacterized protein n=1 Tax=Trypanosoma congolense (strain IL3000) TaxID=1068625 RepID=G0UP51_TRYCI|nr:conserved hypothetical protein [Trypanosoma congolense IL3000]
MRPGQCEMRTRLEVLSQETKAIGKYFVTGGCRRGSNYFHSHAPRRSVPKGISSCLWAFSLVRMWGNLNKQSKQTAAQLEQPSAPSSAPEDLKSDPREMYGSAWQSILTKLMVSPA